MAFLLGKGDQSGQSGAQENEGVGDTGQQPLAEGPASGSAPSESQDPWVCLRSSHTFLSSRASPQVLVTTEGPLRASGGRGRGPGGDCLEEPGWDWQARL